MKWIRCDQELPEPLNEVLVWIDGHRSPAWRNNHALVAYLSPSGDWFEERHPSKEPLVGVYLWSPITIPD